MTSSTNKNYLANFTIGRIIAVAILLVITFFLVSCSEKKNQTETEFINAATEAHATGNSRQALLDLSTGIRKYPKSANLQLQRGRVFLDLEDGSAAEIAFNKAIALGYNHNLIKHEIAESWLYQHDPQKVVNKLEPEILNRGTKDPLIYEVVGRAYIALRDRTNPALFIKNMNIAQKYINEAYKLNPNSTRVLISKAWLSAIMGKLDTAIGWLNKANAIVKNQRENLAVKGELLIRQNKINLARKVYDRLVKKFPQYPQYKLELGYTYLLKNDYLTAQKWIDPIAKQYPNNLRAKYFLSNIALMEKKYKDAKQLSGLVLARLPNDMKAVIINGASSYFLGNFENAYQKLSYFYNRTKSIAALKLLVATKLKLGEDKSAVKMLRMAGQTVKDQTDTELLNLVAVASAKIGQTDIALKAYQKLARQNPGSPAYKNNVGLIQIAQGDYDVGFKNLEKSLKETKSNNNSKDKTSTDNYLYILANKALQVHQYIRAASYIKQYKKMAEGNYKPWIMSAVLQTILKKPALARQDFNKAMKISPDVAEVKSRYAIFENMQGNHDKALKLARAALKLDPGDIGSGKLILTDLVKQKKFGKIKDIINNAVTSKNISAISKLLFADYYTMLGTPQKTLNILRQLPKNIKTSATYKIIASRALLRNGQGQRAVPLLESFSTGNPKSIKVLKYLLQSYIQTRNKKKYQSTLEKIGQLAPHDFAVQIELAKLYVFMGKYDQAKKKLGRLKTNNDQQKLQQEIIRATIATNRKNFTKALAILAPLSKKYPKNGGVSMLYAHNLANDHQLDEAIRISKAWADQHPDNLKVKQALGDLYLRIGRRNKASLQYETILNSKDKIPPKLEFHARNNLAMIYLAENQSRKAMAQARKALDLAPNNPAILDTFARVLMKQGEIKKAINHFNQALALLPDNDRANRASFSLGKAQAFIQGGQKKSARKILSLLIRDNPKFAKTNKVRKILSGL